MRHFLQLYRKSPQAKQIIEFCEKLSRNFFPVSQYQGHNDRHGPVNGSTGSIIPDFSFGFL